MKFECKHYPPAVAGSPVNAAWVCPDALACNVERLLNAVGTGAGFMAAEALGRPHQKAGHDALLLDGRMEWKAGLQGLNAAGNWPSSVLLSF